MTLTGSYIQDREEFPGFWEHDVSIYLYHKSVVKRRIQHTLDQIKKQKEFDG